MICCEQGKFPIKIIQGDTYRNAYIFYDNDGNVITNNHIAQVYWNCDRLNYQQILTYDDEDSSWVFYLQSSETNTFTYCKTDYDLTLYFNDEQVSTEIYRSELRVLEKKNKPTASVISGGEPFDYNNITTEVYTGIIVGGEGGVSNYNLLINKPKINGVELMGNKTAQELGIEEDKNFIFTQYVASNLWIVEHNLNKRPSVTVVDTGENVIIGDIKYLDNNSLQIIFTYPFSGYAYLN